MKLTNNHSHAGRGFAVKNGASVVAASGETLDGDFDLDHPVMRAWLDDGSITKGKAPAPQLVAEAPAGYAVSHIGFGNYGLVDAAGVQVVGEDGAPLLFKKADGDAQANAQAAANKMNGAV
jgi:hypothetical protein